MLIPRQGGKKGRDHGPPAGRVFDQTFQPTKSTNPKLKMGRKKPKCFQDLAVGHAFMFSIDFLTCFSFEEDPGSLTEERGQRVKLSRQKAERNKARQ